jgi:putative aminopeptidase FrvX
MKGWMAVALVIASSLVFGKQEVHGQERREFNQWETFVRTPSVSGYEGQLAEAIRTNLKSLSPKTDNLGNVFVTLGSGEPHRMIVTPMDQPGYVLSEITEDGYLRVQRLPQRPPNEVFDLLHATQPVAIQTRSGKSVPGVFAGLSVHLQPLRQNAPKMAHPDEMYIDIGAKNAAEVRSSGVDLLDPVSLVLKDYQLANDQHTAPAIGDHFGVVALLELLHSTHAESLQLKGTLTFAFLAEQWTGGRGLDRILNELRPDELIYVGRLRPAKDAGQGEIAEPGDGVLIGGGQKDGANALAQELTAIAKTNGLKFRETHVELPRIASYSAPASFPARMAQVGVPIKFTITPAETLSFQDTGALTELLSLYVEQKRITSGKIGSRISVCSDCQWPLVSVLTDTYGASRHEEAVREKVKELLPEWARKKVTTDAAGNLVLHIGDESKDARTPRIAFVAHMDEIGYEVKKIEDDGRLQVEMLGGGYTEYFLGHAVLVHKKNGQAAAGVLELPDGWDKTGFEWPSGAKSMDEPAQVYVGTRSKEETEKLGIASGDFVTIPKEYRHLQGTRATARSFDDRVGCAALIAAVKVLGPSLAGHDVTFVWSTREELGLQGAAAFAEQASKEGRVPDFVFAIDTFVSSDSPLESKRFADAELGKGFVLRAVDNSNVTPLHYVDRAVALAKENGIAVQYGVTGGGNDGSAFLKYGSVDIPLGWPLRYAHSPGEVIDTKDLDALGKIVEVLAREW